MTFSSEDFHSANSVLSNSSPSSPRYLTWNCTFWPLNSLALAGSTIAVSEGGGSGFSPSITAALISAVTCVSESVALIPTLSATASAVTSPLPSIVAGPSSEVDQVTVLVTSLLDPSE